MKYSLVVCSLAVASFPSVAQDAAPAPLEVARANSAPTGNAILPANTEVVLEMTQEVTTKGKTWSEGDQFKLSVASQVMLGEFVVIPEGTPAYGKITWLTNKGMFGKSGKMDIELEYLELGGRRIKLDGTYRQDGEGNTLATVGGVVLAGPFAAFITGKSGRIPQGRELTATTEEPIELAIAASEVTQSRGVAPLLAPGAAPIITATAEADIAPEPVAQAEPAPEPVADPAAE